MRSGTAIREARDGLRVPAWICAFLLLSFLLFGAPVEAAIEGWLGEPRGRFADAAGGALILASDPVLPIPSSIVATALGARLGFWWAAAANSVGLLAGAAFGYGIGRGGRAGLPAAAGAFSPRFEAWTRRYGIVAMLICRPVPILAEASLILLGAAGAGFVRVILWAGAAQLALAAAYAAAGASEGPDNFPALPVVAGAVGIPLLFALIAFALARRHAAG